MEDASNGWKEDLHFEFTRGWARWASFAAIWLWCCLMNRITALDISTLPGMPLLTPNFPALCGVIVALVPFVLVSSRVSTVVGSRRFILAGTVSILVGSGLIIAGHVIGSLAMAFCGGVLGGMTIGIYKIAWGETYSQMTLRRGLLSMGFALVISTSLAIVLAFCPVIVAQCAFIACALVCGCLLEKGFSQLTGDGGGRVIESESTPKVKRSWMFLVLPVLVAFTSGIVTESRVGTDPLSQPLLLVVMLSLSELVTGVILIFSARFLSRRFGAAQIYAIGLLFSVAGYLIYMFQLAPLWVAGTVTNLGFSVFYFFMIVFWGNLAARMDISVVKVYAMGYLAFQGSSALGQMIEMFLMEKNASSYAIYLAVVLVLLFFAAILFLYGDSRSPVHIWLTGDEPVETDDRVSEACMQMSRRGKLTPREYEVLIMLARGRTASYISHSLGISYDTAKTHIKNIYSKLDVHNQQDLMDDVEALSGGKR